MRKDIEFEKYEITIKSEKHFYKIVNILNKEIGRGKDKWTFVGSKHLSKLRSIYHSGAPLKTAIKVSEEYDPIATVTKIRLL